MVNPKDRKPFWEYVAGRSRPAGKRARHTGKIIITTKLLPVLRRRCSLQGNGRMADASPGICGGARHRQPDQGQRAVSPIVTHKLRNDIFVLEGSGGNIAVLTESDRIVGDLHLKKLRLEARPFAAEENYNPNPRRVAPRKDAFACFHEQ